MRLHTHSPPVGVMQAPIARSVRHACPRHPLGDHLFALSVAFNRTTTEHLSFPRVFSAEWRHKHQLSLPRVRVRRRLATCPNCAGVSGRRIRRHKEVICTETERSALLVGAVYRAPKATNVPVASIMYTLPSPKTGLLDFIAPLTFGRGISMSVPFTGIAWYASKPRSTSVIQTIPLPGSFELVMVGMPTPRLCDVALFPVSVKSWDPFAAKAYAVKGPPSRFTKMYPPSSG